jgi:di/tricarboxylate transporter
MKKLSNSDPSGASVLLVHFESAPGLFLQEHIPKDSLPYSQRSWVFSGGIKILKIKPTSRAALIRMIRLEAKKVMINQKGLSSRYAEMRRWMPKIKKKQPINMRAICRIH